MTWVTGFIAATLLLFFAFAFTFFRMLLSVIYGSVRARSRIYAMPSADSGRNWRQAAAGRSPFSGLFRHLSVMLESVGWRKEPHVFIGISIVMMLAGVWLGLYFFLSAKGVLVMGLLGAGTPYLWLRMRLLNIQGKARLEFLPAVEVIYQQVVLAGNRNLRNTLHQILQEQRIRYPIRTVFEQLVRNLSAGRSVEESLRLFTVTLGHVWAKHLANMFAAALEEGTDITGSLRDLIADMRKAQLAARHERNRLLEIRIANFSPIVFLLIFVGTNFRMDKQMAYSYYVLDPQGRDLLLEALLLIFASFVMGVYLSVRRG